MEPRPRNKSSSPRRPRLADCSRPGSSVVRQLAQVLWRPIFLRHGLKLGRNCPLHPWRDAFRRQEEAKKFYRADLWACGFSGRAFVSHGYLDKHLAANYQGVLSTHETSVCLADYCDVFRCGGYLPEGELPSSADYADLDDEEYAKLYPDLGAPLPPWPRESTELALAPPKPLLDLLHIRSGRDVGVDRLQRLLGAESPSDSHAATPQRASYPSEGTRARQGASGGEERPLPHRLRRRDTRERRRDAASSSNNNQKQSDIYSALPRVSWRPPPNVGPCDADAVFKAKVRCEALLELCVGPFQLEMEDEAFLRFKGEI